jgi:hypothetical protein
MNRLWSVTFIVCLALIAGFSTTCDAQTKLVEKAGGFSYVLPAGWKTAEFPGLKYKIAFTAPVKGFAPNINVVDEKYAGNINSYMNANIKTIQKMFSQLKVLGKSNFNTRTGLKGKKVIIQSVQNDKHLRQLLYLLPGKSNKKYVVTFSALAEEGGKYDKAVEKAVQSFAVR